MFDYFISACVTKLTMTAVFFSVAIGLELALPLTKVSARHRAFNLGCGGVFLFVDLASSYYVAAVITFLSTRPLIALPFSDHHRVVFAFGLAFVWVALRDFFYYWLHRFQHFSKWLWAEHALHHSDENMNATTAIRHHWLENPLNALFVTAPLVILFRPPLVTIPLAYICMYSVSTLIHCNVRLNSGILARLIATPQVHRIHHSCEPLHMDKNFAQFFPVWDVIFGTFYQPKQNEFPHTGLDSGERITRLAQAVTYPFSKWHEMTAILAHRDSHQRG